MNVLVFDIETIPDIEGGQEIFDLQGLDNKSTAKAMYHLRQQKTGSKCLPLHLHKIVAISIVYRGYRGISNDMGNMLSVHSLGNEESSEAELLELFFKEIDECSPTLVSWNGYGFDLPVIHYRTLKNSISAPGYWEKGKSNSTFRYDSYLNRYNDRHTDLKDVLASYNRDNYAPLGHIATMLGFPGKNSLYNSQVWDEYQAGNLSSIRNYCESDVLNIYLIYLRYQLMCGEINHEELEKEFTILRDMLDNVSEEQGKEHLQQFLKLWAK